MTSLVEEDQRVVLVPLKLSFFEASASYQQRAISGMRYLLHITSVTSSYSSARYLRAYT